MKYAIFSQPKSGTYLCAELLVELGIKHTYKHLNINGLKYGQLNPHEEKNSTFKVTQIGLKSLKDFEKLIEDNAFFVSHRKPTSELISIFKQYKKIVLIRDTKEREQSLKNWYNRLGEDKPIIAVKGTEGWAREKDTFLIDFKDLIGKNYKKVDDLQVFLFGEIIYDSKKALCNALKKKTFTKSPQRAGDNW